MILGQRHVLFTSSNVFFVKYTWPIKKCMANKKHWKVTKVPGSPPLSVWGGSLPSCSVGIRWPLSMDRHDPTSGFFSFRFLHCFEALSLSHSLFFCHSNFLRIWIFTKSVSHQYRALLYCGEATWQTIDIIYVYRLWWLICEPGTEGEFTPSCFAKNCNLPVRNTKTNWLSKM